MTKQYEKFLAKQDAKIKAHFVLALESIQKDSYEGLDIKKLSNSDDVYRIRIGKYRIIFLRKDSGNMVLKIESRGDAYKGI